MDVAFRLFSQPCSMARTLVTGGGREGVAAEIRPTCSASPPNGHSAWVPNPHSPRRRFRPASDQPWLCWVRAPLRPTFLVKPLKLPTRRRRGGVIVRPIVTCGAALLLFTGLVACGDRPRPQAAPQRPALTGEELTRRAIERRAIEAINWGMPAVNEDLMLQAMIVSAKGRTNQIAYWSRLPDWTGRSRRSRRTPTSST